MKVFPSYYSFRFVYFNQSYMLFILFFIFFFYRQVKDNKAGGKIETMRMLNEKNLQKKNYFLKLGFGAEA